MLKQLFLFLFFMQLSLYGNGKVLLEYWTPFTGGDARPMQFIVNKFNNSQDEIIVNMKVITWAEYYDKLELSVKSNKSPDIAIVHASKLAELIADNQLTNITKATQTISLDWSEFSKNSLSAVTFNNNYYAIPIDTHLLLTFYNKKYLKEAKLLDQNENLKIDSNEKGVLDFFHTLKQKLPQNVQAFGQPINNIYPFWIWFSLYNQIQNGGEYIVNNKAAFNNEAGLKALNFLVQLREEKIYSSFINDEQSYNMFKYNKSAILLTGSWATWNFEQINNLDFAVAPFIQVFDKIATWSDSHTLAIPKNKSEEKKIAALKFANFVANEGIKWSQAGHIPSKVLLLSSESYKQLTKRFQYSQYLDSAITMPKHKKLWQCNNKMVEILATMMQTKKNANDTLQLAEKEINKILQSDTK
jgi:multiple sugar transport system substrate-binding protein